MDVCSPAASPHMYMSDLMTACYSKFSALNQRTETVTKWIMGLWLWGPVVIFLIYQDLIWLKPLGEILK